MKLYYWKSAQGKGFENFGDDLNPWIFNQICPEIFNDNNEILLVGIGSILNNKIPKAKKILVFSSGVGYADLPVVDSSWKIYCVRGLLSAKALGLSERCAITDGAVLAKKLISSWPRKTKYHVSYMPHMSVAIQSGGGFRDVCEGLNINYIDPQASIEDVLDGIINSDKLITEALHGAIIADAMRVPWMRVRTNNSINDFKWNDWQSSLNLEVRPIHLFPIWALSSKVNYQQIIRRNIKKTLIAYKIKQLKKGKFYLSDINLLLEKERKLHAQLSKLILENK